MSDVAKVLEGKGSEVLRIDADATVFDAIRQMVDSNVGALVVTEGGNVTGIVTERDYLRRVVLQEKGDRETTVGEIMTSPLIVVTPDTSVDECMSIITERRIRHLPVAEEGDVIGLISIGDVVKFTSTQQSAQIRYLTDYINAR